MGDFRKKVRTAIPLEEEKKRVVEKINLQLGEGQEWKGVVEISTEDMDFLVVDRKGPGDNLVIKNLIKENISLKY